ncbi:MAG: hypothetical protein NTW21_40035 [Verrucomicrobia bacterium]|nr:hypothetical protein [Verrucomicrobiota bacterium]
MQKHITHHRIMPWVLSICAWLMSIPPARAANTPQLATGYHHTVVLKSDGSLWASGDNTHGKLGDGTFDDKTSPVRIGTANDWSSIAVGADHTVALKSNGTLWTWGLNNVGQLGDGTTAGRRSPGQVGTDNRWVAVTAGGVTGTTGHTVALKADGTLWAWGNNDYGQLGDGTGAEKDSPVQVGTATTWVAVAAGSNHTVALKADGTLWAWGDNSDCQLGDGTTVDKFSPVQVGTDNHWVTISAGDNHTVALKSDGSLWAWGFNSSGQLGDASTMDKNAPVQVGTANNWVAANAGATHTVGLKSDGSLWVWGNNYYGQLGDGTSSSRTSPVQCGTETGWVAMECGNSDTFALKSDGSWWACGNNSSGQLGDGTTTERHSQVQTGMDNKAVALAGGGFHSLAVKSDGTLWAWGGNAYGQLGNGNIPDEPSPVPIGTEHKWASVAAGEYHSLALKADGSLWAWGKNTDGQLGDGTSAERHAPVRIGTDDKWASVVAGAFHSMALKADGTLWAWGDNSYGQLGDGTTTDRHVPLQIGTANTWVAVAGGPYHTLALKADGTLWAWGSNDAGQVGDGTTTNRHSPVQIATDNKWVAVAAGADHSLAIKADGTLWAWGYSNHGQLGDGTVTERHAPVQIGTDHSWVTVTAGEAHSLARKADGTLWAWGSNGAGQLGDGTTTERHSPVQVGTAANWIALEAGFSHTLALMSDGTLWTWGWNFYSQLGLGDQNERHAPATLASASITTNTVIPAAGTGGTMTPGWAVMANYNTSVAFTITPDTGYHIVSVTGCGGTLVGTTYTTGPITAAGTVTATFAINQEVVTAAVSNIATTTATCGGNVIAQGPQPVTARGVCWNTDSSPTVANSHTTDGSGLGAFTSYLTGLTPGRIYYVRAYAISTSATSYGAEEAFITLMTPPGNSLQFDGTNDYVSISDSNTLDMTSNYTLECWFKADSFGGLRGLIDKYQTASANGYLLRLTGTDLDFDQKTTSGLALQAGRWYHVAAVNNNGTRSLYVNGVAKTIAGTPLTVAANTNELRLACDYNSRFFAGQLDEARVWNVARTQDQIRDAMHRQLQGSEAGLVAYYNCNHANGMTVLDLTANTNDGYLANGTVWTNSTIPCANTIAGRSNLRGVWNTQLQSLASGRFSIATATVTNPNFAILGHDNTADNWQTGDVPATIAKRLTRVWQTEVSGTATGDIVISTAGLIGGGDGANLRLLSDADGVFASGASVVTGTFSAQTFTVSGQSLATGSYYTLALLRNDPFVPQRVADINPGSGWSNAGSLTLLNGMLYFRAGDGTHGDELWKSDGTAGGTTMVKDIYPGSSGSNIYNLMVCGGKLFMGATDGTHGIELWTSDGTTGGTTLVKDIYTGAQYRTPHNLTAVGDRLFFFHENATYGDELWKSDGTDVGTVLVKDANPGTGSFSVYDTLAVGNLLYYGGDPWGSSELWRSDGTDAGTYRVKDINPTGSAAVNYFAPLSGGFLFAATDGVNGTELWKSDGTEVGTVMVKDINPDAGASSSPMELTNIAGTVFFSASLASHSGALWKSDGTETGTVLVKNINPSGASDIRGIMEFKGMAFFRANDGTHGTELWRSDGTATGTVMVKDIYTASSGNADPTGLTVVGDWLFFTVNVGPGEEGPVGRTNHYQLWRTDGTTAGTQLVMDDTKAGGGGLLASGNSLYLSADGGDGAGSELWRVPVTRAPGNCLAFDGTNDYVNIGHGASLDAGNTLTIEAWIKPTSMTSRHGIFSTRFNNAAGSFQLEVGIGGDGTNRVAVSGINTWVAQTGDNAITPNVWTHIAYTRSGPGAGTHTIYVNGVAQTLISDAAYAFVDNASDKVLGSGTNGGQFFPGPMDEVRVWNVARTQDQIRDAMHRTLNGDETGLLAYYRFDHDLGTTLADFTANQLDGTLVNGPVWTISTLPCAETIDGRANLRGAWLAQPTSLASSILNLSNTSAGGTAFRVIGHAGNLAQNTTDKPASCLWRLDRAWQTEGAGNVTGDLVFDCSSIAGLITNPANLRLLADPNGVFADAAAVPGSYASGIFTITGQSLANGSFYTLGELANTRTLTATAGPNGTIDPTGTVAVPSGGTQNFHLTPDTYYHVADVTRNGVSVGAVTDYSWTNVTADGAIHATFAPDLAASGTPTWWLAEHGWTNNFDAAEAADTDGDGQSAAQEYLADTNPTATSSVFRVTGFVSSPAVAVTCASSASRLYTLYRNTGLAAGTWLPVSGQADIPGTGGPLTLHDTSSPQPPHCFYRIGVRVP